MAVNGTGKLWVRVVVAIAAVAATALAWSGVSLRDLLRSLLK